MSKALKKLIDINGLRELKNKLIGTDSAYVQPAAVDQTVAGTKTFSKPIVGSVTGSSGSCTGNATSATKLQTARTINGTAFNGTANITTANWGTARNIAIADETATNTGKAVSVNGSAAVTLKLPAAIKANITGSLTGNAATATKATQDSDGNKITTTYSKNGHTHDDRYYTEAEVNNLLAGKANSSHTHPYIPTSASCNKNWHWSGRGGQPTWLWGGEDGTNMYVYNPLDFRVNYANSANSAVTAANGVDSQAANWIRFRNGIQICWDVVPCGTSGASTWTYGASFSYTPVVTVCDQGRDTRSIYLTRAGNIGTTSCLIVMVDENNGSYATGEAQCIAIGTWK